MKKQEAADFLGCSIRQLERYTSENRIGVRYEKGRTRPTPVYDEGEVRAFKDELERVIHRPAIERMERPETGVATQNDSDLSLLSQTSQLETLTRFIIETVHATKPDAALPVAEIGPKLLLTLAECQTLTGLSRQTLRAAIDSGDLKGRQIGRAWRVKRSKLESYIEGL
jgi:excisionase family DNA binding protein